MISANLFLIGAPKCGITSLFNYLAQHPDIYAPTLKEPHYYCNDTELFEIKDSQTNKHLYKLIYSKNMIKSLGKFFIPTNFRKQIVNKLKGINRSSIKPIITDDAKFYLAEFFQKDISELENLISKDLSKWIKE